MVQVTDYVEEAHRLLADAEARERLRQDSTALVLPGSAISTSSSIPAAFTGAADVLALPKYEIHVPRILRRRGLTDVKDKRGPKQIPIEDQAGSYFDESTWDDFVVDPLGRDKFTVNERREEWLRTEELYHENCDAPIPVDPKELRLPRYGIHLSAGGMGSGKTLLASYLGRYFRRRGWNVFSTAGLLFGQRLSLREAYAFPDVISRGCFIFVDEVHTFVDRYSANSVRGRTFGQSSTAMRKEEVTCLGASANSLMVGWEYKGAAECVLIPKQWYPRGKLHAPPFCHIGIMKLYPFPYQRQDQLLMDAGAVRGIKTFKGWFRPNPQELMGAAKLMDSFESVRIGENFGLDAAAMRQEREGKGVGRGPDAVWLLMRLHDAGLFVPGEKVYFNTVTALLEQNGVMGVKATAIRAALATVRCPVRQDSVHESDLADLFNRIRTEKVGDDDSESV